MVCLESEIYILLLVRVEANFFLDKDLLFDSLDRLLLDHHLSFGWAVDLFLDNHRSWLLNHYLFLDQNWDFLLHPLDRSPNSFFWSAEHSKQQYSQKQEESSNQ